MNIEGVLIVKMGDAPMKPTRSPSSKIWTQAKKLRPLRQGSLDSYCGLYAVANAILRLRPEIFGDDDLGTELFRKMVTRATLLAGTPEFCTEGLDEYELGDIAKSVVRHLGRKGYRFQLMTPKAALSEVAYTKDNKLHWLVEAAKRNDMSVILYVEDIAANHWSVLGNVTGERVRLFDSDAMDAATIVRCEPWRVLKLRN